MIIFMRNMPEILRIIKDIIKPDPYRIFRGHKEKETQTVNPPPAMVEITADDPNWDVANPTSPLNPLNPGSASGMFLDGSFDSSNNQS
jgi:hypothetical protein